MSAPLLFIVPGAPVGKQRARSGQGRHYTPERTAAYEGLVQSCGRAAFGSDDVPFPVGPVSVEIHAFIHRPARIPAWCTSQVWSTGRPVLAVGRVDGDNVRKAVLDGLGHKRRSGWRAWGDDNQVATGGTTVWYAGVGAEPCVVVRVERASLLACVPPVWTEDVIAAAAVRAPLPEPARALL